MHHFRVSPSDFEALFVLLLTIVRGAREGAVPESGLAAFNFGCGMGFLPVLGPKEAEGQGRTKRRIAFGFPTYSRPVGSEPKH